MDAPNDRLSEDLLAFAKGLSLLVTEAGTILHTSSHGAGYDVDHYIASYDGVPHIEIALSKWDENNNPIGSTQMLISDPIDDETARSVMERWATLAKLEEEHDGRFDTDEAKDARDEIFLSLLRRVRRSDRTS